MTLPREVAARVEDIAARLRGAERLLFVTGAGMSVDSGLPTYRGIGGLYEEVVAGETIAIEEALSGTMFARDPALCWSYIRQIEEAGRGARPNAGHLAVAELERQFEVLVLTQNVDGLHQAAGSTRVIDIHGDVRELVCTSCDHRTKVADFSLLAPLPRCPSCEAVVRPDVVLFGEVLPARKVAQLSAEMASGFDAVLSVGTSSLFPYIAEPVLRARMQRALTVEINPDETTVSSFVEERLASSASETLEALARSLRL